MVDEALRFGLASMGRDRRKDAYQICGNSVQVSCMATKNSRPKKTGNHDPDSNDKPRKALGFEVFVRGAMSAGTPPKAKTKKRKAKK